MKAILNTLVLILIMVSSTVVMANGMRKDTVGDGAVAKSKSLFVFKTQKKLLGGHIQIFSSNGELLTTQTLNKKKMIIDFNDARYGVYTILVTKGVDTKVFHFLKK